MKPEYFNAVTLKRELQKKAEQKLMRLSEKEQINLLQRKYGHLRHATKRKPRRELQPA